MGPSTGKQQPRRPRRLSSVGPRREPSRRGPRFAGRRRATVTRRGPPSPILRLVRARQPQSQDVDGLRVPLASVVVRPPRITVRILQASEAPGHRVSGDDCHFSLRFLPPVSYLSSFFLTVFYPRRARRTSRKPPPLSLFSSLYPILPLTALVVVYRSSIRWDLPLVRSVVTPSHPKPVFGL